MVNYSYDRTAAVSVTRDEDRVTFESVPESAYLHSGNGGLTLSIKQRRVERKNPSTGEESTDFYYSFSHHVNHMGGGATGSFDLTPNAIPWMIKALARTYEEMQKLDVSEFPYDQGVKESRDGVEVSPQAVPMFDSMDGG